MNKDEDCEIYRDLDSDLHFEDNSIHKRKVLHTRMVKLASARSRYSYCAMGMALFHSEQIPKSIFSLKRFLIIDPENINVQIKLAQTLLKLKRDNECLDAIKKALLHSSEIRPLHRILIETLQKNHRSEDLTCFLEQIAGKITDQTRLQQLYVSNAFTLTELEKHSQALVSWKKVLEINPAMNYYHHYEYAMALSREDFDEEAIVQFEHSWRLNPEEKSTINHIAYLNYCLGKFERALEVFNEIVEKGLDVFYTYSNYILLLYHLDQHEGVIKKYEDLFRPHIKSDRQALLRFYQEVSKEIRAKLARSDIDKETKRFNEKKLKGVMLIFHLISGREFSDLSVTI